MSRKQKLREIRKIVFGDNKNEETIYIKGKDGNLINQKRFLYKQMKRDLKNK